MNDEPKVSVIIPFYTGVLWLKEAVQSVLDQTYKNFEIFVVNDGSKEDMSGFIKEYGDKINYIYQANSGPGLARNKAIEKATGKYIAFLDSDDLWKPEKTKLQIELMERTSAMWSHTNVENFFDGTNKSVKISKTKYKGDISKISSISLPIATPALIIRKDCFDNNPNIRFAVNMRYGQDSFLYRQLSYLYPIENLNEYVTLVRKRGGEKGVAAGSRARVQLKANRQTFEYIKANQTQRPPLIWISRLSYRYYYYCDKFISSMEGVEGIKGNRYEWLSRVLYAPMYFLGRIYLQYFFLSRH